MAELKLNPILESSKGAYSKDGMISRQKVFRDASGRILAYGKQEGYFIANPRDFKRNPMKGKELAHHNLWREVCAQTKAQLLDPDKRAQWETRFNAQLPNRKGAAPDPQAPIDKFTAKPKCYIQLHAFVRAMIYQQLLTRINDED